MTKMKLRKVRRDRLIGIVLVGNYRWQIHKQMLVRELGTALYKMRLAYLKVIL